MHIATFCTLAYCNVLQHFILQTLQKPGGPALMWCASFIHIDEGSLISYSRGCCTYYWKCRTFMHSIAVLLSQNHCSASDCTRKTIISQYYLLCFICFLGFLPEHKCHRFADMLYHICSWQIEASLALIIFRHSSSDVGSEDCWYGEFLLYRPRAKLCFLC